MNILHTGLAAVAGLVLGGSASASVVYGLNLRGDNMWFQSSTDNFVGAFANVGAASWDSFAIDMDVTGTTMYAILTSDDIVTNEYGTVDITTGEFTSLGNLTGTGIGDNVAGMSVDPISGNWYLTVFDSDSTAILYEGDITTGTFAQVGALGDYVNIDLAIDAQGNAYGHDIVTDQLLSIDLGTGLASVIGSTGFDANFAQGMDFDYSTGMLYATLYTGGGTGQFGFFDLNTGELISLADTVSLNAEMEMVVASAIPAPGVLALFSLALVGLRQRRRA